MPVGTMNEITKAVGHINIETHPSFLRLKDEGFEWVTKENFDEKFLNLEGLKMAIFSEDPNAKRVTVDIAVIAPELKKAFAGTLTKTVFTAFEDSRAIGSRWGIFGMPAVALFMDTVYLGAVEGLKDWNTYCKEISEIVVREKAPTKRVFVVNSDTQNEKD